MNRSTGIGKPLSHNTRRQAVRWFGLRGPRSKFPVYGKRIKVYLKASDVFGASWGVKSNPTSSESDLMRRSPKAVKYFGGISDDSGGPLGFANY